MPHLTNRYPGECAVCDSKVLAGEGGIHEGPLRLLCVPCGHGDRPCEQCQQEPRVKGQRFCPSCKKALLAKMQEDGYLEYEYRQYGYRGYRGRDAHEAPDRDPSPWLENAVRALEDCEL